MRDLRSHVPELDAHARRELPLERGVPLLGVAGAQRGVHGKDALAEAGRRRWRDRCHARAALQHERWRDVVQRPLGDGLQEWEGRRRERRGDTGHLDPDQAVADADERPVGQAIGDAETGTEVVLLQRPHRLVAGILEQLRLQIEDTHLPVDLGRWEVQRVAQPGRDGEAAVHLPVVLHEVLLKTGPLLDLGVLQIDGERLDLSEQEAGQRRAAVGRPWQIAPQLVERERAGRRRRLNHVQPLPPPVESCLDRVAPLHPRQRVRHLRDAGVEVRRRVDRRSEDLIAGDRERRQRIRKLRRRGNAWNVQRRARRRGQLRGGPMHGAPRVANPQLVEQVVRERVLIVGGKRPRRGVLRTECAGRGPAPFRQRRHRLEVAAEVREAAEDAVIPGRELMIEAHVPVVLIVDLAGRPPIVVRGAG